MAKKRTGVKDGLEIYLRQIDETDLLFVGRDDIAEPDIAPRRQMIGAG